MFSKTHQLIHRSISRGWPGTHGAITLRWAMLQRSSFKKLSNMLAVKIQKRLQRETISAWPYRYKIDPTNHCNLHCPLCPTGLKHSFRKKGMMPLAEFRKIIDQISPHALLLDLFGWGEPMLHPDIFHMIRCATDQGLFVRMSSTLDQVTHQQLEQLVDSGLDALIVAMDGSDATTHGKFRAGGDLSQVISAVETMVAIKQKQGGTGPHITIRMLINRHNEDQIHEVKKIAADLGVDAFTVGHIAINTHDDRQAEHWLPRQSPIMAYGQFRKNQGSCSDLWESLVINYDGAVSPCCWQYHEKTDIGNCFTAPVEEIWNSPEMVAARRLVLGRNVSEEFQGIACRQCQGAPDYLK